VILSQENDVLLIRLQGLLRQKKITPKLNGLAIKFLTIEELIVPEEVEM
jgi:hypothetical protein